MLSAKMDLNQGTTWPRSPKTQLFPYKDHLLIRQSGWLSVLSLTSGTLSMLSAKPIYPEIKFLGAQVHYRLLAYLVSPCELVTPS